MSTRNVALGIVAFVFAILGLVNWFSVADGFRAGALPVASEPVRPFVAFDADGFPSDGHPDSAVDDGQWATVATFEPTGRLGYAATEAGTSWQMGKDELPGRWSEPLTVSVIGPPDWPSATVALADGAAERVVRWEPVPMDHPEFYEVDLHLLSDGDRLLVTRWAIWSQVVVGVDHQDRPVAVAFWNPWDAPWRSLGLPGAPPQFVLDREAELLACIADDVELESYDWCPGTPPQAFVAVEPPTIADD